MLTTLDKAIVALIGSALTLVVSLGVLEEGTAQQIAVVSGPVITAVVTYFWPNKQPA